MTSGSRPDRRRRAVISLELVTGAAAVAGGLLLAVRPDGSLLHADHSALAGTPFPDWRVPGLLLAVLVGCGVFGAGWWLHRGGRYATELSILAGIGLIAFEATELAWLGFQPLEALFALVGASIAALSWSLPRSLRPAQGIPRG